jgi:hypothetical protein
LRHIVPSLAGGKAETPASAAAVVRRKIIESPADNAARLIYALLRRGLDT